MSASGVVDKVTPAQKVKDSFLLPILQLSKLNFVWG